MLYLRDEAIKRQDARHILRLVQTVASIFTESQWAEAQRKLIDDI